MTLADSLAELQSVLATWSNHPASHHHQATCLLVADPIAEPGAVYASPFGAAAAIALPVSVDMVLITNPADAATVHAVLTEWHWHVVDGKALATLRNQSTFQIPWLLLAGWLFVAAVRWTLLFR